MQGLKDQVEEWTGHGGTATRTESAPAGPAPATARAEQAPDTAPHQPVAPEPDGPVAAAASTTEAVGELTALQSGLRLSAASGKPLVRAWLAALGLGIIGVAVLDQSSTPLPPPAPTFNAELPMSSPTFIPLSKAGTKPAATIGAANGTAGAKTPQGNSPARTGSGGSGSSGPNSTTPAPQSGTDPSRSKQSSGSPTAGGAPPVNSPPEGGASSTPILVLPASPAPQLVAVGTGILGVPVALNVGTCTGLQLGPLSLGCTSP